MAAPPQRNRTSSAAGLSAGTGFSGVVLLLPDGPVKSILLIIAPTITVVISSSWYVFTQEIEARVADWRIRSQKNKAAILYERLKKDEGSDPALTEQARQNLNALTIIEVEITKRLVDAIVSS